MRRLLPLLAILLLASACSRAIVQPDPHALDPKLSELEDFYRFDQDPARSDMPVWLLDAGRTPLGELERRPLVSTQGGREFYDLDNPPRHRNWVNPVLYPVVGLPRDLVDGCFGVVGLVPPFNLAFTGLAYELLPTQYLFRHPSDWHRWPGRANRHGHGWYRADAWGYFSNLRHMPFSTVDAQELEHRQRHNAELEATLQAEREAISTHNAGVDQARAAYLESARRDYLAGDYRSALRRLEPYLRVHPAGREAKAMLTAALVALLPELPERDWAEARISQALRASSTEMRILIRNELKRLGPRQPDNADLLRYRVWVESALGNHGEALEAADRLCRLEPANVACRRLRFEAALAAGLRPAIDEALDSLSEIAGPESLAVVHARARRDLLDGDGDPAAVAGTYRRLAERQPGNPRFHYLRAMALIAVARGGGPYARGEVLRELRHAERLARSEGERALYTKARRAALLVEA